MKTLFLINILDKLFLFYTLMLIVRIFSSWVPEFQHTKFIQFIAFYTDPYLNLFRRFIPPLGMLDLSPIVAFLFLSFLQQGLINLLVAVFL
jgi:YggT family protein